MKFSKSFLIALLLTLGLYVGYAWIYRSEDIIVETDKISDIYKYIKPNQFNKDLLVIFDIDNTLAKTPTDLGSDQWFYAKVDQLKAQGIEENAAINLVLPELFNIQFHSPLIPIEKDTVSIVNDLQKRGVSVIALTARSLDLTYCTIEQLQKLGIYFTKTDPYECPLVHGHGHKKAGLYIDGIIFSGEHSKGEMLISWFKQSNYRPKKIIMVDDKLKNLQSVEKALLKRDYPFIGIRYSHEDEQVNKFTLDSVVDEERAFLEAYPMNNAVATP